MNYCKVVIIMFVLSSIEIKTRIFLCVHLPGKLSLFRLSNPISPLHLASLYTLFLESLTPSLQAATLRQSHSHHSQKKSLYFPPPDLQTLLMCMCMYAPDIQSSPVSGKLTSAITSLH